jgi:two-component system cell cycle response regulator
MKDYKEELLKLLKEFKMEEKALETFFSFFENYTIPTYISDKTDHPGPSDILSHFGIRQKDIENFCTIKRILLNDEDCFRNHIKDMLDYFHYFMEKFLNIFCNFNEENAYDFVLDSIRLGFTLSKTKDAVFDFYKAQNIVSSYVVDAIKRYQEYQAGVNMFELTASFIKFSNFASEIVSLAYYEKVLMDKIEEVYEIALKDSLTSLYTRAKFEDIRMHEFSRSKRYKLPLSLCMLDIDDFKKINDNLGHLAGDKVLREIGHIILNNTRRADLSFRWGGEEFLILLTNTDASKAEIACKKLLNIIRSTEIKKEDKAITFTVSMGLTELKDEDDSIEKAIERADKALYMAKKNGKNRIEILT